MGKNVHPLIPNRSKPASGLLKLVGLENNVESLFLGLFPVRFVLLCCKHGSQSCRDSSAATTLFPAEPAPL